MDLPCSIAVHVQGEHYCIFLLQKYENKVRFIILENPKQIFGDLVKASGFSQDIQLISVERISSRANSTHRYFQSTMTFTGEVLKDNLENSVIPIVFFNNSCTILPSVYTNLKQKADLSTSKYTYKYSGREVMTTVFPTPRRPARHLPIEEIFGSAGITENKENTNASGVTQTLVPQRVINTFIEGVISKNETCPVMIMPLEKETTIITPCWHAMSIEAKRWIERKECCPVCKQECKLSQLMNWIDI